MRNLTLEQLGKSLTTYRALISEAQSILIDENLDDSRKERLREIQNKLQRDSTSMGLLRASERETLEDLTERTKELYISSSGVPENEGLHMIPKRMILEATTPAYRNFLREAGYGDLDSCDAVGFGKRILRVSSEAIADTMLDRGISLPGSGNDIVNISQTKGRELVQALGYKLPTTALMYKLFIPYVKEQAQSGNVEAQATLNEMTNERAEWLEDLILDTTRIKIGRGKRTVGLPSKDGYFDRSDINELGYPTLVRDKGEFYHWHVSGDERAAFRYGGSELNLILGGGPSIEDYRLGVRLAKIF